MTAIGQPPEPQRTDFSAAAKPRNTGKPAGGAFLIDFSRGFDGTTQYLSNHDVNEGWNKMFFRPDNAVFDANGMKLSIARNSGREMPYTMGEFQRAGNYGYGRYEVVMRAAAGEGVVSAFFTHTGPYFGDPHHEIDFEFLGRDPHTAVLNYYSDGGASAPLEVPLNYDATKSEHLYAFEWLPDSISWFIDGALVRRVSAEVAPIPLPTASSRVMASVWVGNGETTWWVGNATIDKSDARYRCMSHVPVGEVRRQCSDVFPQMNRVAGSGGSAR